MNNEVWLAILGGGLGVAIVTTAKELIMWALNRGAKKRDIKVSDIDALVEDLNKLENAQKISLHDRIKHLAKTFIVAGVIDIDDREALIAMHKCYQELGGNGHLDDLMKRVKQLNLKEET
jgi:hypothetical protein|nr:MAG TPA: holin protein [Caudoviricetes sp.]